MHAPTAARSASWASLAGGLGAALVPKCPLCIAAYGSALGAVGVSPAAHRQIVEPALAALVVASFGVVLFLAVRRHDVATPVVSAMGAALLLGGRFAFDGPAVVLTAAGALLFVGAALANAALCRRAHASRCVAP